MKKKHIILVWAVCLACNILRAQEHKMPGPHLQVYKTKKDYRNLVPINLSDDKTKIISYPDPKDIRMAKRPTKLHKGYLLDNRGIGKNVAFLKMSYAEFSNLPQVPTMSELMEMIIDKDPLKTICDCGLKNAYKEPVKEMNWLIDNKKLGTKCKEEK